MNVGRGGDRFGIMNDESALTGNDGCRSGEWIDHSDTVVGLAVVKVFGVESLASGVFGGGEDQSIPVTDLVAFVEKPCIEECLACHRLHGEEQPTLDPFEFF